MTASSYLTEDDDEDYIEDCTEQDLNDDDSEDDLRPAASGLAQNSLPYRPRYAAAVRALQERSANIQTDLLVRPQRPVLRQDIPCFYGSAPETRLTNRSGDWVLRWATFYQLTPKQYRSYQLLIAHAMEMPKYKKYRLKPQSGKQSKGNQDIWENEREELFFKALVKFPPVWRDKRPYEPYETPNKDYGRNELIAFYINDVMGAPKVEDKQPAPLPGQTVRKQVSSHLQVLKHFFKGRPDLLIWLASSKKDSRSSKNASGGDRPSRRRPAAPYQLRRTHSANTTSLPNPPTILPSQGTTLALEVLSTPIKFCMSLRTELELVHTFSHWQKNASVPYDLRHIHRSTWSQMFPFLEGIMKEVDQDCQFLFAECALNLADGDLALANKILEFDYAYQCDPEILKTDKFDVHTRFYDGVNVVAEAQQDCAADRLTGNLDVGFFSKHWLQVLHRFCQTLKLAIDGPPGSLQEPLNTRKKHLNKAKAELEAQLKSMTAVQKITHHRLDNQGCKTQKVVLTVHWKFRLTKQGEIGTTSFRELIMPPQRAPIDVWSGQDYVSQAARNESSFGIKDDTVNLENPFADMSYSYNSRPEGQESYSYDNGSNALGFQLCENYGTDELSAGYDPRLYEAAMISDLPPPIDTISSGSEAGENDLAAIARASNVDMSMFDYNSVPAHVESHGASGRLLGPGDGLHLNLHLGVSGNIQLDEYDPDLVGNPAVSTDGSHSQQDHYAELPGNVHHAAGTAYAAAEDSTAINIIDPFAHNINVDHEPTHFHHYHRRQPRLHLRPSSVADHQQHHSHNTTPEILSPVDQSGNNLVLAQPWYPAAQYSHNNQSASSLQHSMMPPPLTRHDSDATIEADMSDVEDFAQNGGGHENGGYSLEGAYSQDTAYTQATAYSQDKEYLHHGIGMIPAESFHQSFQRDTYAVPDDVPRHLAVAELEGKYPLDQVHQDHNQLLGLGTAAGNTGECEDGDWEMLNDDGEDEIAPNIRSSGALL